MPNTDQQIKREPLIAPQSIQEQVTDHLRRAIVAGQFTLGERLVEGELADRLGVSRAPVREALQKLTAEGLVDHIPRIGRFVHLSTPDQVREVQEIRGVLEGLAARKAAERVQRDDDPGGVLQLQRLTEDMQRALAEDQITAYFDQSRIFHETLMRLALSETLQQLHAILMNRAALFRQLTGRMAHRNAQAIREHLAIADAIRRGEPDQAEALTREHSQNGMIAMLDMLSQRAKDIEIEREKDGQH